MLKRLAILALATCAIAEVVVIAYALAQPAQPPQTNPLQEAISRQLGDLIIANASCSQQSLTLASQLRETKKELDDLRAKYEPVKSPKEKK